MKNNIITQTHADGCVNRSVDGVFRGRKMKSSLRIRNTGERSRHAWRPGIPVSEGVGFMIMNRYDGKAMTVKGHSGETGTLYLES